MKSRLVSIFNEEFAQTAASMAKEANPSGEIAMDVKAQLIRVSNEAYNAIAGLKKTYIDRKNLLLKIANSMGGDIDPSKKSATRAKIDEMVEKIDERIQAFDNDLDNIKTEAEIIKKNDA
jgi:phenylalanyl-tRNA synthetase alpha subunit